MKDFMKMVGATMVGLLLWSMVAGVFCLIGLAGIAASEGSSSVEKGSILRIRLSGEMTEREESTPMALLMGGNENLALDDLLKAIEKAAIDENVEGIYLEGGALMASPAMAQELRQALVKFKESKKFVWAYADTYSQSSYYVCSAADSVFLNPEGILDWHGLSAELMFYTDVLKKLGVKMQVFKVGSFKSAVEPYINTEMSEPNREQMTSYLNSIWNNMLTEVSESRKVSKEALNAMADSMMAFKHASELVKGKMVDRLCYKDEVRSALKKKTDTDEDDRLTFVSPAVMAKVNTTTKKIKDCIGIYYAYGDIVDDNSNELTGGMMGNIVPGPMNKELDKLMNDDDIKAVVIRVNSGGGSAYASEQIWRQVSLLKAKKPVVISMGGAAASGGYYISCNASHIVAEPTTLTGSIGIFGMIPDVSELMTEKIGMRYDNVKTNKHSDFGTTSRPMNEEECRIMQTMIERGYDLFTRRVAEGRNLSQDSVKAIAEGRVWTGEQAKRIGLVDELGDLQTAIKAAARLAKSKEYVVDYYPAPESWIESLMNRGSAAPDFMEGQMQTALGEYYDIFRQVKNLKGKSQVQAALPYRITIK